MQCRDQSCLHQRGLPTARISHHPQEVIDPELVYQFYNLPVSAIKQQRIIYIKSQQPPERRLSGERRETASAGCLVTASMSSLKRLA
jgi:hypothetical protein